MIPYQHQLVALALGQRLPGYELPPDLEVLVDLDDKHLALKCPKHCAAPMIDLLPIPFGKQRARRRAHRHALVNLALQILRDAAYRSSNEAVGTIEVRLALHVLRPFVGDSRLLVEFWKAATIQPRHPWTSCHLPYRWIAERLIDGGEPVDDANRP